MTNGIGAFVPPPPAQMRRFFAGPRRYFYPEFLGLWELDLKKPALFVGNHTLFGLTDANGSNWHDAEVTQRFVTD